MGIRSELFSWRIPSSNDRRTYFLNVKENRTGDLYLAIVESKKRGETDFERHQVMIFEEDFTAFEKGLRRIFDFIEKQQAGKGHRQGET